VQCLTQTYKVVLNDSRRLKTYSAFTFFHRFHTNLTSNLAVKHSTVSRLLSTQDVTTYWARFREVFSPQREKLWDGLLIGLQRYHHILESMSQRILLLQG